ncbi:winged helix-turn-helix domain-containing protein [Streptomyces sp. NPDC002402]
MADDQKPLIDASRPEYVYVQLADALEKLIKAGQLRPGARLPGERDLADEYQVSIGSARRAVQELRDRGLVVTVPAKGTFIVEQSADG